MPQSVRIRKLVALGVLAAWACVAATSWADTLEDARKVSAREDSRSDQAVQQALATPAAKPEFVSVRVTPPRPTSDPLAHVLAVASSSAQLISPNAWDTILHDPPRLHRVTLFQLFCVYRL